ncbi:PadR family transcriptional regulator [Krasilnikovia sp. M28-CT-15]|uniref:PadR family transcriptional regulator n=1 Tax=Krasilnikovia sp. M28-CT-15 TaxID=3373540 RepID=UPI003875DBED
MALRRKREGPRITLPTAAVLRLMLQDPTGSFYGLKLAQESGFPSGTIYPILARLEAADWVQSYWEQEDAAVLERPRRRMYQMTGAGAQAARAALSTAQQALGIPASDIPTPVHPQVQLGMP